MILLSVLLLPWESVVARCIDLGLLDPTTFIMCESAYDLVGSFITIIEVFIIKLVIVILTTRSYIRSLPTSPLTDPLAVRGRK